MTPTADETTCPACGKSTPAARHCRHCGALMQQRIQHKLLSSDMPDADYGVFLLAIPLIAVFGMLVLALAKHSVPGMVWLLALTIVITASLAAAEIFQSPSAWDTGNPLKPMVTWLCLVTVFWPIGFPAYMRARHHYKLGNWLLGALFVEAVFIGGAILAGVITVTGYGKPSPRELAQEPKNTPLLIADPRWIPDPNDIYVVKTAHLDNCPGKTLEQEVNGFFASPRWDAGATADGGDFVNVSGIVTYQGKPTTAVFQFLMFKDKKGFKLHAFTINDVPQSIYVAAFTLAEMCGS
ncbi:MAG: hypothetical protein KGL13_06965 [Gammaproteobacteria bacterium]|nr:hypothetical protein [Gammaproteobacteria bacterium]MDE2346191.1 hypothetical protein [Gammaproteobacteria bacterium]